MHITFLWSDYKMNVDLYKISKELSKEITDLGFGNISEEIENIISGGSTGCRSPFFYPQGI